MIVGELITDFETGELREATEIDVVLSQRLTPLPRKTVISTPRPWVRGMLEREGASGAAYDFNIKDYTVHVLGTPWAPNSDSEGVKI